MVTYESAISAITGITLRYLLRVRCTLVHDDFQEDVSKLDETNAGAEDVT